MKKIISISSIIIILTGCFSKRTPTYEDYLNRSYLLSLKSYYPALINQHLVRGADLNSVKIGRKTINPLNYALKKGRDEAAWFLLKKGAAIDIPDSKGWTPLMWAIHHNELILARELIERGANVNHRSRDNMTPINITARYITSYTFITYLLNQGALVNEDTLNLALKNIEAYDIKFIIASETKNAGYKFKTSPLLKSVLLKDLEGVRTNFIDADEEDKNEALTYAAAGDNLEILSFLWSQEDGLRNYSKEDDLLKTAVYYKQERNVRYLLDQGVKVTSTGPFYYAVLKNQPNIVEMFITDEVRENSHNMLIHAIREADPSMVELLLKAGLKFDKNQMFFPNDILKRDDCRSIIEYLLTKGFDINKSDDYDSLIRYSGFLFVDYNNMVWLLDMGADPALFESAVYNPIATAAKYGYDSRKVETLLNRGGIADNNSFITALRSGDLDMVKAMVEHGADLTAEFREIRLLTYAAGLGYEHITEYLIKQGMDINRVEKNGMTPLWVAVEENKLETVEVLLKNGADTSYKNSSGLTVLEYSQKKNRYLMTELIKKHIK